MRLYWCDSGDDHDGPDDHEDFNEDVQVNPIKKVLIVRIYLQVGTFRGVPVKKIPCTSEGMSLKAAVRWLERI